jgi:hypothetical protein
LFVLFHDVRFIDELSYHKTITEDLPKHEYLGEMITEQLIYYPSGTQEVYKNHDVCEINPLVKSLVVCSLFQNQRQFMNELF